MRSAIGALLTLAGAFFALTVVASVFIFVITPSVGAAVSGAVFLVSTIACLAAAARLWRE